MRLDFLTIFPSVFPSYLSASILGRAQSKGLVDYRVHDLRDWAQDKHKKVDDAPFGGGAGMVMKVDVMYRALCALRNHEARTKNQGRDKPSLDSRFMIRNSKTVLLSAKGKNWNQSMAKKYAKLDRLILISGRYEGVDERVRKFVDEEISIGEYVLTGGELGALVIADSVVRLLPGVLGNQASAADESHSSPGLLEYPQYTRPEIMELDGKKYRVPKVLLSGDHRKIEAWRRSKMKRRK